MNIIAQNGRFLSVIIGLMVVISSLLRAGPPSNDSFASPVVLSGFPVNYSGGNYDATLELDEPAPYLHDERPYQKPGIAEASVWFRWTATTTGPVQIDAFRSSFDTILAVWEGSDLTRLTEIASNDNYQGYTSAVFINATVGVTYQVAVYGNRGDVGAGDVGAVSLCISPDVTSRIAGTVTGPDGSTPLGGIEVIAYRRTDANGGDWDSVSSYKTYPNGSYSIGGLAPGTYRMKFRDWQHDYLSEFYSNAVDVDTSTGFNSDAVDLDTSTDIRVPAEKIFTGIDVSLAKASRIAGTVTGSDGTTPLKCIMAKAYRWTNEFGGYWESVMDGSTDASGSYSIGGLAAGTYRVEFRDLENNYARESYADAEDLDLGVDILVAADQTVSGINASLAKASRITGTVTGPDGITPLGQGKGVRVYRWNSKLGGYWEWVSSGSTDASGSYSIDGLAAGTYRVGFSDWQGHYFAEFYGDGVDLASGTDILVPAEKIVTGISVSLARASRIEGTVTGSDGNSPLESINASAYRWTDANGGNWTLVSSTQTSFSGNYSIGGLTAGTYRVEFTGKRYDNYTSKVYGDAVDLNSGIDILVPAEKKVTGIDASLALADPSPPAVIVGFQMMSSSQCDIHYTGKIGQIYIIQVSSSLGVWTDEKQHFCRRGLNIVPLISGASSMFWRLKTAP